MVEVWGLELLLIMNYFSEGILESWGFDLVEKLPISFSNGENMILLINNNFISNYQYYSLCLIHKIDFIIVVFA